MPNGATPLLCCDTAAPSCVATCRRMDGPRRVACPPFPLAGHGDQVGRSRGSRPRGQDIPFSVARRPPRSPVEGRYSPVNRGALLGRSKPLLRATRARISCSGSTTHAYTLGERRQIGVPPRPVMSEQSSHLRARFGFWPKRLLAFAQRTYKARLQPPRKNFQRWAPVRAGSSRATHL